MALRRIPANSHIVFRGNKVIYRGNELKEIERLDAKYVLINLGGNTYKKFQLSIVKNWLRIKRIELKCSLEAWYEEDGWQCICEKKDLFSPIQFLKYIISYNHAVSYLNEVSAMSICMPSHYRYKKVRIHFYNGETKKMELNKFIKKYFDDNVF
jgi:hypothetical protein